MCFHNQIYEGKLEPSLKNSLNTFFFFFFSCCHSIMGESNIIWLLWTSHWHLQIFILIDLSSHVFLSILWVLNIWMIEISLDIQLYYSTYIPFLYRFLIRSTVHLWRLQGVVVDRLRKGISATTVLAIISLTLKAVKME